MALSSTRIRTEFTELPLMRALIDKLDDKGIQAWSLEFWRHQRFDPESCHARNILVRDLNTCLALKEADGEHVSHVARVDLTFNELRRYRLKDAISLLSDHGDRDIRLRVCINLIDLTSAQYRVTILSYLGLEDDTELWAQLGDEALQYT
jgi:hypothetical protein